MKEKQLYLSVTALTMIFTNQLFAEEPPILQQEVEFRTQLEIKRSQERLMEQERRMAQEQAEAEAEAIRQKEAKQRAADQARLAKKAEAKRLAEQQGEKDKVAVELKDNRLAAEKKKQEETDSYQQLLRRMDEYKTADKPSMVSGNNLNEFTATPSDLALAKGFLNKLPLECSSSYVTVATNNAVNIRIVCYGSNQSMDGLISIKNGILTHIK